MVEPRPAGARMVFPATCGACGVERKFMEFKIVPCGPHADAERREYGFRCLTCKTTIPTVRDAAGIEHLWERGQHVERPSPA